MKKLTKQFFCNHQFMVIFSHKITEKFCTISHYKGHECSKCGKRKITDPTTKVDEEDLLRSYRLWMRAKKVEKISYNGRTFYF